MRGAAGIMIGDELGPRARRVVTVASAASAIVLAGVAWVVYTRLRSKGQLAGRKWRFVTEASVWRFLLGGLAATLKVAAVAMVLAMALGALLALGRLAPQRAIRVAAATVIEFFRAVPLLMLIFFVARTFPKLGLNLSAFWFLAIALTAYNGAILAEVFRAGILSLDRGQSEAAQALGMGWWQTMGLVVVPQALRRMIPAIVSQLVTLLKDSSLGFVLPYEELLRRAQVLGESFKQGSPILQALVIAAAMYIVVNVALSRLAQRLEVRQRRSTKGPDPMPADPQVLGLLK